MSMHADEKKRVAVGQGSDYHGSNKCSSLQYIGGGSQPCGWLAWTLGTLGTLEFRAMMGEDYNEAVARGGLPLLAVMLIVMMAKSSGKVMSGPRVRSRTGACMVRSFGT